MRSLNNCVISLMGSHKANHTIVQLPHTLPHVLSTCVVSLVINRWTRHRELKQITSSL
jgi:hypothetical protein